MRKYKRHIITAALVAAASGIVAVSAITQKDIPIPGATNPDVTQATLSQTICNPNWSTKSIRPPVSFTNPIKQRLCLADKNCQDPSLFELDHGIALTDGGNPTSLDNLWLQPADPRPGFHEKDQVEVYIHKQICSGVETLAQGQNDLLHWKSVWAKMQGNLGGISPLADQDDN